MRDKTSGYASRNNGSRWNNQGRGNQGRGNQWRGHRQGRGNYYDNRNHYQNRSNWNQNSTPFGQPNNYGESHYGPRGGGESTTTSTNGNNNQNRNQNPNSNSNRDVPRTPQDEPRATRLKGVNKDTWDQFTFDEKIESQYEDGPYCDFYLKQQMREDSDDWIQKKQEAAEATVNQLMEEMNRDAAPLDNQSEYESDSGDSYMQDVVPAGQGSTGARDLPYPRSTIENFIDSLQYNLIFNVGFDLVVVNPDDEKSCKCPCSKYMTKWRENFKCTFMIEKDKCTYHKRAAPKGLMDHLRKLGGEGAYLHRGIEIYITKLYENYWGAVGHKALYNGDDAMYKLAQAAETKLKNDEKMFLEERLERLQRENKEQEEKLRQNEERIKRLEQVSKRQADNYKEKMELYEKLGLERKKNVKLDEATVEKWRKVTRNFFDSIEKILKMAASKDEKITIKLPFHFILQDFFEERYKSKAEQNAQNSSFLFRELKKGNSKQQNNDFSYKLFLKWNVEFDAPKNIGIRSRKMRTELKAVDEGGPTSQFISEFCMQLGDLSVMLPFESEVKYNVNNVDGANDWKSDLLVPLKGSKVMYKKIIMTVTNYSEETGKADLSDGDGTEYFRVQRKDFKVKTIPIKIFESTPSGCIPENDAFFSNHYDMYVAKKFTPEIEKTEFEEKARLYFRAIGRFLLHVIYDGKNPIPTSVMPELYRNVLLRNCEPDSDDYDDSDVLEHFMNLEESNKDKMKENDNKYYGVPFEEYEIEKEGVINEDNFIKDFVPAYMIEKKKKNINALREGLTLNGEFPIDILGCQPLQAISQQFFSNDTCSVEDIIALLRPEYDFEFDDDISKENHDRFMKETMPEALRNLSTKNSSFLLDFVLFVTGSRCIPYTQGMPDFNVSILFDVQKGEKDLPSCHTCENLLHVPWNVYDNDAEVFAKKVEQAVEFGKDGFDMA
eukprot:CAMPEP_0203668946 /NCGR_PEP_ID=MMETSP0090-20130426/5430_1 /ASSEMBLY_ACC=CAM_ASM_001088 /TAXON_ID=426623 /ORGANISM="Chaetoceros affinis, Strain CCMP159" /LENGTH=945 /DNA_ID=CAMNT_0050533503 /DNA_START=144 /DNA_END=2981 /DNA_ORIENTATION=-